MRFTGKWILSAVGVLVVLSACATSQKYQQGMEFEKQNKWEDALQFYQGALSEDESNQTYIEAVERAKKSVVKQKYNRARQRYESTSTPTVPFLNRSIRNLEDARKLDPDDKELRQFTESLQKKRADLEASAKSLYDQADADMQKEEWTAALAKLRQVAAIYPEYENTTKRLALAEQEATKVFYQQGVALGKQEEWKMAAEAFKAARDINPQFYDVSSLYEAALAKDSVEYYLTEAEKAGAGQNWERAILLLEKAVEYKPDDRDIAKKLADLKDRVGQLYFEDTVNQVNHGRLSGAAKKIHLITSYSPRIAESPAFRDLGAAFCTKAKERADKFAERELWGNALVWYQRIESVNPNHEDLFQKMLTAKDNVGRRIKKSIAVFDFSSPSSDKDAGKIAANKLIAYLHKNASGDLRIIERENLQSILREMQLGQTGIVDVKSAQNLGKMRGIDTFIMGDVLIYSAKRNDTTSSTQVKVLVDEEDVRNPEFSDWLLTHTRPNEEELKTAPPKTIKKKNYTFLPQRRGSAKISALMEISYKLIDTATGENIFTNSVSGKLIKEDKFQDALPAANIPDDPLEIPTEAEVLDQLTNEKISEMGQSVLKNYQSLEVEYFNQAEQQLKRRNYELAVERYMDAVYDEKSKGISTPISLKAQEMIEKIIADK